MVSPLFTGRESLRVRGEARNFWMSLLFAPLTIALIGLLFHSVTVSEFLLLIVGGMAFVSISRGRLIGSSVRIDSRQFPEVHALVERLAHLLGVPTPQVFLRDDLFVPIAAIGVGEPYALVISSQYLEHLREGELAFLIARELAHVAAGHTRLTSLLSVSGRENPAVALVFGAWLRSTEYTADRVGLLCAPSVGDAIGAISITTFHTIGRRVDMAVLAEQRRELEAQPTLRMGEWIGAVPYATNRMEALRAFDRDPLAAGWRAKLQLAPLAQPQFGGQDVGDVTKRDLAPRFRRIAAIALDCIVLSAIVNSGAGVVVKASSSDVLKAAKDADVPTWVLPFVQHGVVTFDPKLTALIVIFFVYSALLVGVGGQTLGMMIMELRVVTTRFAQPSVGRVVLRYTVGFISLLTSLALFGFFFRVHPHDRVSGTRMVRGRGMRT